MTNTKIPWCVYERGWGTEVIMVVAGNTAKGQGINQNSQVDDKHARR